MNAAIIGPGNIGSDLMLKILSRGDRINLVLMSGIDLTSEGLVRAKELGIDISDKGVEAVLERNDIDLVFDCTSAYVHKVNGPKLKERGIVAIDLTPAALGPYCVPAVNMDDVIDEDNLNLITCGGQATIPIVAAINKVADVEYAEIIATVGSKSIGPGTRQNIDEFTVTTRNALIQVGGADDARAINIINPAEPPILMRNTIYCLVKDNDIEKIKKSVDQMVENIKSYVPGYTLKVPPIIDGNKVTTMIEVEGEGQFLPKYAGNLDIITAAALGMAERIAENRK